MAFFGHRAKPARFSLYEYALQASPARSISRQQVDLAVRLNQAPRQNGGEVARDALAGAGVAAAAGRSRPI
jgi:hypothetical protein